MRCILKSKVILISIAALICAGAADAMPYERGRKNFTVIAGFGQNHQYPSATQTKIKFDVANLRWGECKSPRKEKALELGIGSAIKGEDNFIVSTTASYRRYFLVRDKVSMAYELGGGLVFLEHTLPELGSNLNFTEQVGIVVQRKLKNDTALTLNYRFFHISNAGLKKPNIGLNSTQLTIGFTKFK
ncbi:MAG: acyloxyacyl hydrolase [Armatimonadetes bacterium]|nr:acyloxyacyl hydrolase [Armatimonadota bacterium]